MPLVEICHLYISLGRNFFGHHGRGPDDYAAMEVSTIECVAGRGIRGDRFLDHKDYKGQITFFALEVSDELCAALKLSDCSAASLRRNIITREADLNALIEREFEIQGVRFHGVQKCRPRYWMDRAVAPGAEKFLRGCGGLRARILTDGILRSTAPIRVGNG
jgi:MOSC domain-containing protein YiiM